MTPQIIAHRGASYLAPENTLTAFKKAMEIGADGVEMDVQQTIDAGLVIHHDYMIDLHTDISGKIYDMTMGDLKELDFGSWKGAIFQDEKIATLQEAMELCRQMPGCTVHLELKSTMDNDPDFVPRVLEVLQQTEMVEQVILVSFNHALLRQAKQLLPELRVGALVYGELESMLLPPPIIWKDLGLTNGIDDMEAMDAALPESAADEENCSWMTRWMSDKVSMLRANFPGESLNEIYKNLLSQRDLPGYIRSLDFVPEWVSCEYHTAYKNAGFIDKLHEMGIKVSLWTVDTEDSVRSLLRTSADAYITNRPDRVREWMEKEQAATAPTETATAEPAPAAAADARDSCRRVNRPEQTQKRDRLSRKGIAYLFLHSFYSAASVSTKVSSAVTAHLPSTHAEALPTPTAPCCCTSSQWRVSTSPGVTCLRKRALLMPPNSASLPLFSGRLSAATAPVCASASSSSTPGMTGCAGKWPLKNSSLRVTHLRPMAHCPGS